MSTIQSSSEAEEYPAVDASLEVDESPAVPEGSCDSAACDAPAEPDDPARRFAPQHAAYLHARAVDLELAWNEGVRSVDEADARRHTGNASLVGSALAFPYGRTPYPYLRVQLDDREANGKKTCAPAGITPPPYIPSTAREASDEPLYIVEAPAKALAMVTAGFVDTIGCGGVDAGIFDTGTNNIQVALEPFLRPTRPVIIIFDAGRVRKPAVARAEARIARALADRGIPVRVAGLPYDGDVELGPDDYLVRHGRDAMRTVVTHAKPADPVEFATLAVKAGPATARRVLDHLPFVASLVLAGPGALKSCATVLKDYTTPSDLRAACRAFESKLRQCTSGLDGQVFLRGDDVEVAERFLEPFGHNMIFAEESSYLYRDGVWHRVSSDKQIAKIARFAGTPVVCGDDETRPLKLSRSAIEGALRIAQARVARPLFFEDAARGLAFANGFLHLEKEHAALTAHSPDHRARFAYPFAFDPDARCPEWLSFLASVWASDEDRVEKTTLLREFVGASLFGLAPRFKKALMLHGDTNSGKSTLLDILLGVFPEGSTRSVGFHEWEDDYARRHLAGALLNTVAEVPSSDLLRSESFKAIVAGDKVKGRAVFERPFEFRPTAGHVFAANTLPKVNDRSDAVWERFAMLSFRKRFQTSPRDGQEQAIPGLAGQILAVEVPGILAWAVGGLERLLGRGGTYTMPPSARAEALAWKRESDPLEIFFDEELVLNPGAATKTGHLYRRYEVWCMANGITMRLTHPNFGKQFKRVLAARTNSPNVDTLLNGRTVYRGVQLRKPDPLEDDPGKPDAALEKGE